MAGILLNGSVVPTFLPIPFKRVGCPSRIATPKQAMPRARRPTQVAEDRPCLFYGRALILGRPFLVKTPAMNTDRMMWALGVSNTAWAKDYASKRPAGQ